MKRLGLMLLAGATLAACQKPGPATVGPGKAPLTDPRLTEAPPLPTGIERTCTRASDCKPVGCECVCSGGGVGLKEDVVGSLSAERWYKERGCAEPTSCNKVLCSPSRVDCVGGLCHVVYGAASEGAGGSIP